MLGVAKHQGKGIHSTTNSYIDSLLEVDWADTWWNDSQGSQVTKQGRRAGLQRMSLRNGSAQAYQGERCRQ